jgi:hypothetical protein
MSKPDFFDEIPPLDEKKDIVTIFCGAGAQTYVVKGASSVDEAIGASVRDYRVRFHLFHLEDDGIGKMSAKCNAIPKGCVVLDIGPLEPIDIPDKSA